MLRLKLSIRLVFVKLPNIVDVRIFRDSMLCMDPDERSYQDLSDLVERKLTFMELPPADFTVFYREPAAGSDPVNKSLSSGADAGDRVVVDTAYFSELLHKWWNSISDETLGHRHHDGHAFSDDIHGYDEDEENTKEIHVSFEVEVNKLLNDNSANDDRGTLLRNTTNSLMPSNPKGCAILTMENLKAYAARQLPGVTANPSPTPPPPGRGTAVPDEETLVHVADLTSPPRVANYFLRCVVMDLRFKTPRPGLTVTEIDLSDAEAPTQLITAVSFDAAVQKEVKEHLRDDGRQVIELRHVHVRAKNEAEARYSTNAHPLLLRVDRHTRVEIVQILPVPIHGRARDRRAATPAPAGAGGRPNAIVTVRETPRPAAVVELSDLVGLSSPLGLTRGAAAGGPPSAGTGGGGLLARSSSSGSSAPHRTTFSFLSSTPSAAPVSGVVPSSLGRALLGRQEQYVNRPPSAEVALPFEPGLIPVTSRDVRARERVLIEHANHELQRKERIRRRREVSTACLLCGLDCEDEAGCMEMVSSLLQASSRNRGTRIPSFEELKHALCDQRGVKPDRSPTRLVCEQTFVNTTTKTVHVVHCRCAHLCSAYQSGKELEDIVWCDLAMQVCTLCGMPGACVACYHPECAEIYHVVCALFSVGYVNFGKKDPYLPCPACPRHTQVVLPNKKRKDEVLHTDESCWTDDIAFDSRVVTATDLRDPDENDGE